MTYVETNLVPGEIYKRETDSLYLIPLIGGSIKKSVLENLLGKDNIFV